MCRGRCENMQNTRDVEGGFFFEGLESKKQNLKIYFTETQTLKDRNNLFYGKHCGNDTSTCILHKLKSLEKFLW